MHAASPHNPRRTRVFLRLWIAMLCALRLLSPPPALAGGPRWVAGAAFFNASALGQPIVWSGGRISYYVDLGPLSTTESNGAATTLVTNAAAVWNAVPTAAVQLTFQGNLAEDVNGSNVSSAGGTLSEPSDIEPTATTRPVAVIFDADGSVLTALYGAGAADPTVCPQTGVYSQVDNMSADGHIAHALIIVNGLCATNAGMEAVLEYQLIRAFGRVLGLDWSQANEEQFATSSPTDDDLAGWPMMHPVERLCSENAETCLPDPTTLRTDDIAALNRLYPVTTANQSSWPSKQLTAANTVTVRGTVSFRNGQGMQGINVVLQPLNPLTGLPDLRYTATAVSGAYFTGNAGSVIAAAPVSTAYLTGTFGSNDTALEGYYEISGVPLPAGETSSGYQLTLEAVNSLYTQKESVGPYVTGQVTPSGTLPTVQLGALAAGADLTQDITIDDSAGESFSGNDGSQASPAAVPPAGEWTSRLTGYGHASWFAFSPKANREYTVEAQSLDDSAQPTTAKAMPLIGAWNASDALGTTPDVSTTQPFNGGATGLSSLAVVTVATGEERTAIADARGDGRPDYLYRGRILYADSVQPSSLPAGGGPIVIEGIGFRIDSVVKVNGRAAQVTSVSPTEITAMAPASNGATGTVQVEVDDPLTLGVTIIADGLAYTAQSGDTLTLIAAPTGSVPMNVPQPLTVRAMNWDDEWPAPGDAVTFTVTAGTATLGCGQSTCTIISNVNGLASTTVSAGTTALTQVTASLVSGASVLSEFYGAAPPSISALTPALYLAIGSAFQWTPQALVLNAGSPLSGAAVAWTSTASDITLAAGSSMTNAAGIAAQTLTAGPFSSGETETVRACYAAVCAPFTLYAVHLETAVLAPVSGTTQQTAPGVGFAAVTLAVTDAVGHPMAGAAVTFYETLRAWTAPCPTQGSCPPAPVLAQAAAQSISAADGTVTLTPISLDGQPGRLSVLAAAGPSATYSFELDSPPPTE
ncbi:IPT/TIG domain-containing protein [Silvibacterium sp.]|uniref:IPT/TIG domain-containing protein n=1 Tax=Silvibacterium sp. TaxID=1964179 RepID=UPI0039E25949